MCKGIKYNLQFKLKDGNLKEYVNIGMTDMLKEIKSLFNTEYNIDSNLISVSNQVIFNMINPHKLRPVNKLILNYCKVEKYVKPENNI